MSLIALRHTLRRQGRRAALVAVTLSLALLAAHHAGVPDTHAGSGVGDHGAAAMHGGEVPDAPPTSLEQVAAACLAVLPLLAAALALGLGLRRRLRPDAALQIVRSVVVTPRAPLRPPRAGPSVLCVMRC